MKKIVLLSVALCCVENSFACEERMNGVIEHGGVFVEKWCELEEALRRVTPKSHEVEVMDAYMDEEEDESER